LEAKLKGKNYFKIGKVISIFFGRILKKFPVVKCISYPVSGSGPALDNTGIILKLGF